MGKSIVRGRHKHRRRIAVAAAAVVLLAAVTTVPAGSLIDRVRAATSLEDLLSGRSPGERAAAGLIKVKLPRSLGIQPEPQQRVKSLVRNRPGGPLDSVGEDPTFPGGSLAPDGGIDDMVFAFEPPGDVVLPPGSGGGGDVPSVPPGTPVIFGPNPESPDTEPTPVAPGPVPEPATWLMMILGFGTIGGALRRARSATPDAAHALR